MRVRVRTSGGGVHRIGGRPSTSTIVRSCQSERMLMRPMPVPAILLVLLVAAAMASPSPARAVEAVPDEPGAFVLPDAAVLQTVVADVDVNGSTDVVRLVRGDGDAALVEVWVERESGW